MRWRIGTAGMLTALAVLVGASFAWAGGNDPVGRSGGARTLTLGFQGGVDTVPVRGYHHHSYRPYSYGYYRPYSYGYYRPYSYGYYRPYAYSYYRPYPYFSYYPRSFSFNFGLGLPYYYAPRAYYYSSPVVPYLDYYYSPIGGGVSLSASILSTNPQVFSVRPFTDTLPPPQPYPAEPTYPYNGDPKVPVPMPKVTPDPTSVPPVAGPVGERLVSAPAKPSSLTYPAYGEALEPTPWVPDPAVRKATREVRLPR